MGNGWRSRWIRHFKSRCAQYEHRRRVSNWCKSSASLSLLTYARSVRMSSVLQGRAETSLQGPLNLEKMVRVKIDNSNLGCVRWMTRAFVSVDLKEPPQEVGLDAKTVSWLPYRKSQARDTLWGAHKGGSADRQRDGVVPPNRAEIPSRCDSLKREGLNGFWVALSKYGVRFSVALPKKGEFKRRSRRTLTVLGCFTQIG